MASPYEVLGIDRDADSDAIDRAYRRRVKEAHPDQGGTAEAFRAVREAYEAITADEAEALDLDPGRDVSRSAATNGAPDRSDGPGSASGGDGATADDPADTPEADDPRQTFEVEYLNYEVLDDHDWGLSDEDLFGKAAGVNLGPEDYGRVVVEPDESLLEAAERYGFAWPFACRGGACANCAVAVTEGDMGLPVDHILPEEMTGRGIRLSCVGAPITEDTKVVYNVKHLPDLDDLRLPSGPFDRAYAGD